ncbi:MAG: S9 family peptidase [Chthonomonadales bacterium]|nr:S9 family peptidase [Chthonomonadales bacterium]
MLSNLPPLIPRDDLFGNPEKASPQLSPDGRLLAYLAPDEGVLNVWLRTLGQEDDRAITRDRKRGIRMYFWAFDGRHLLYLQDLDGDENWHVWSVDVQAGVIRDLTPFQGAQAEVIDADERFPNEILVGLNVRDARVHDVYRIDLSTGATTLRAENPGDVVGWVADADFRVRGAHAARPDGGFELRVREAEEAEWRALIAWAPDEEGHPYAFTPDGSGLYVSSSIGTDTAELREIDTATGAERTLASRPDVDLGEVMFHPRRHNIQAVGFNRHRLEWVVLDPEIAADLDFLKSRHDGEVHVVSRDQADRLWIALYTLDRAPANYYVYDRQARRLDFLFAARPALEHATLAEMRPVDIPSRDGLTLGSYLTLPPGVEARGLPLVLNVHGGPWARDVWGYDPEAQWLANRGYATLQVNYRGSAGYGKRFLHAGDREWGAKMHDDLVDAVHWAVDQGFADRRRVGIYGGSYGGYAALVGAAFTPDLFACAVDIVGPSSLRTLIESIPPYWEPLKRIFTVRVGDPETEPEFLDSRSPLHRADRIECPLLIAQGANDPRVKQAESEQIVAALRERGKDVEYLLFEDEGHGFARPENRLRFYAAAERFLARYLGGRSQD